MEARKKQKWTEKKADRDAGLIGPWDPTENSGVGNIPQSCHSGPNTSLYAPECQFPITKHKAEIYSLTVLEAQSPTSRCLQGRPLSKAPTEIPSLSLLGPGGSRHALTCDSNTLVSASVSTDLLLCVSKSQISLCFSLIRTSLTVSEAYSNSKMIPS